MENPKPALPPPPPARRKSLWGKIFAGCLAICVICGLALVVLLVWGGFWLFSPGKQIAPEQVLGAGTEAVFRIEDPAQDAGLRALATSAFQQLQQAEEQQTKQSLPPSMRWLEGFQRMQRDQAASNAGNAIGMWLPRQAVLAFERLPTDGTVHPLLVANFKRFVRPVRMMIEKFVSDDPGVETRTYRERELVRFRNGMTMTFEGGTLLVSDDGRVLEGVLDRLDQPSTTATPLLDQAAPAAGWDLAGVATTPATVATTAALLNLSAGDDGDPLAALDSLRFGLDVASADEVRIEIALSYADTLAASTARPTVEARMAELAERMATHGLELRSTVTADPGKVKAQLALNGLQQALASWISSRGTEEPEVLEAPEAENL